MNTNQVETIFRDLIQLPAETEWVDFKEAKINYDFGKLGRYFSALSNEANLKRRECGWLVFGVTDQPPREVVGSEYRNNRPKLDKLKQEIAEQTNGLTFGEIHELTVDGKRVLLFKIPPAPRGMPTSWQGHYYGRSGESLGPLSMNELESIRSQMVQEDWSAKISESASLGDLDPEAIRFARRQYQEKNPSLAAEIEKWDDVTFLNKAKVCIAGKMTHTALLLLGKDESTHFLSPAQGRITWVLQDDRGGNKDYQHFDPPLILAVDKVFAKIRNLNYRYMPDASLFPVEVTQYDPWVIREALHNCIAHQDYTLGGRVNVVEEADSLLFTNAGAFLPGTVEEVILRDAPPEQYRNPFLAQAMVNLKMIDTIGSGIKRMYETQRKRFFPLPDYDLSEQNCTKVRIFGKILDENYTRILIEKADLNLWDAISLDRVQKKKPLKDEQFQRLKSRKLVEGRRPNLFVSSSIAAVTDDKVSYIRHRAFDKQYYKDMIHSYLEKYDEGTVSEFERLLLEKISDALSNEKKVSLIKNLLQQMRKEGVITRIGPKKTAKWVLAKTKEKRNN